MMNVTIDSVRKDAIIHTGRGWGKIVYCTVRPEGGDEVLKSFAYYDSDLARDAAWELLEVWLEEQIHTLVESVVF